MNFKLNGLVTAMVVAVGLTAFVGTASAQGIPGTFFAIDGVDAFDDDGNNVSSNTETQVDRGTVGSTMVGTRFSSTNAGGTEFPNGFLNFWEERAWILTDNGTDTELTGLGFTGIAFPPNPNTPQEETDPAIVTTLTGLAAGEYEVHFIYAASFGNMDLQYMTGFSATDTTRIADATSANRLNDMVVELTEPSDINGTLATFTSLIGTTSVGTDGELKVYTDLDPDVTNRNFSAYLGLSIVPVVNVLLGDVNDDGMVTFGDLAPLFDLIFDPDAPFNAVNADVNEDGMITFADIAPLFDIIFGVTSMSDSNGETVDLASNADLDRENNSSVPTGHASVGLAALAMGAVGLRRRRKAATTAA